MDRRSVNRGITRSDLNGPNDINGSDRSHRDDHWSMEDSCRFAGYMGDIHRDVFLLFDMAYGNLRSEQCLLKGETATQEESDEIWFPGPLDLLYGRF